MIMGGTSSSSLFSHGVFRTTVTFAPRTDRYFARSVLDNLECAEKLYYAEGTLAKDDDNFVEY